MRKLSILFLALGFNTLLACGGSTEATPTEEPKTEAPKTEEPKAEEPKPAPAEGEEGEEGGTGELVCCKFTNKEGVEVKKNIAKDMCATKKGAELDAAECPAGGGGGKGGKAH